MPRKVEDDVQAFRVGERVAYGRAMPRRGWQERGRGVITRVVERHREGGGGGRHFAYFIGAMVYAAGDLRRLEGEGG